MKYAAAFAIMSMCLVFVAFSLDGVYRLALWPGVSFLIVALAYAKLGPRVLGKKPDGSLGWLALVLLLPYFLLTWGLWHLLRMVHREDCCNEVAPGLWLGRRALPREIPEDVDLVIDLTAEFFEPRSITKQRTYVSLPVLDASVPDLATFASAVESIAVWPGKVYIQCASGHGRSATLMAAVLIRKGLVGSVDEALRHIKRTRPGIAVEKRQRSLLVIWSEQKVKT